MKRFTLFTLQPKTATEISRRPVH